MTRMRKIRTGTEKKRTVIEGRILKAVGGSYEVEAPEGLYTCKARGIFRAKGISPYAGDLVRVSAEENAEPMIEEILPRKNELVRPPLANLDLALLVISACEPSPNAYVIDKLIAVLEYKGIEAVPVFTKLDLADCGRLMRVYEEIGYRCFSVNNKTGEGVEPLQAYLRGKISALIGNSGVGKSSLMNLIFPNLGKETGEISKKLGRGRHTTREALLVPYEGGYIADTPGFSTVEVGRYTTLPKESLKKMFREFPEGKCRFADCAHLKEAGCFVREAVSEHKIAESRYADYVRLYDELSAAERY